MQQNLPSEIEEVFSKNNTPEAVFSALLPALGEVLKCDRIFLYLRNPHTQMGKIPFCWRRSSEYPEVIRSDWEKDPESLPDEDPLFAAGLHNKPSVFVEDVETANPEVLNKDYERQNFGHRALIHAHLCENNLFWRVLQPAIFGQPRIWTEFDHFVIDEVTKKITPLAVEYVKSTYNDKI
ncbi:GAF domain-containing protein [Phormidium sp. LEGE 05292]|uniref:GAF domain-containing protein n=1 Tax=[Phormidium] sp. LEGE 05292 TaxID=767427 RepID=UPI0018817934|nr:GAF domain-containing protein [Phormidium sp. LEGE 05292]MBE9224940.1 GAF domain-containing protein [Phormidium sp. LEGE 05292]